MNKKIELKYNSSILIETLLIVLCFISGVGITFQNTLGFNLFIPVFCILISISLLVYTIYFDNIGNQIKSIIGVCFLSSELILFALTIIILPKVILELQKRQGKLKTSNIHNVVLSFLGVNFFLIFYSNLIEFSPYTILFWYMIVGGGWVIFIYYFQFNLSSVGIRSIFRFFKILILIQIPILMIQSFIHRDFTPGDSWTGSWGNNPFPTGYYLIFIFLYYTVPYLVFKNAVFSFISLFNIRTLAIILFLAVLIFFNDQKSIVAAFFIAILLFSCLSVLYFFVNKAKNMSVSKNIFIVLSVLSLSLPLSFFSVYYVENYMGQKFDAFINNYIDFNQPPTEKNFWQNNKFYYYNQVYVGMLEDRPNVWLLGVGPGRFGSRTSNMMAYDILYKDDAQFQLPASIKPYSSPEVKIYMANLWTPAIANSIKWRSAILSFPFGGLATIKAELGIFGILLMFLLIFSFINGLIRNFNFLKEFPDYQRWNLILILFWIALPIFMFFDNMQEKPQIILPMYLLSNLMFMLGNSIRQNYKVAP